MADFFSGVRYRCNISVNFISLLVFPSAKNLLAIRSWFESYLQSFKSLQEFRRPSSCKGTPTSQKVFSWIKKLWNFLKPDESCSEASSNTKDNSDTALRTKTSTER